MWVDELKSNHFIENLLDADPLRIKAPSQKIAKLPAMKKNNKNKLFSLDRKNQESKVSVLKPFKSSGTKIQSSLENKASQAKLQKIEIMEKDLRYIKILKKRKIITDQEYEKRKEKLLNQL